MLIHGFDRNQRQRLTIGARISAVALDPVAKCVDCEAMLLAVRASRQAACAPLFDMAKPIACIEFV